jgi:Ni/Co efflux regulator RcnB
LNTLAPNNATPLAGISLPEGVNMNRLCRVLAVSTIALTLTGSVAVAQDQDHHDDQNHHQQYVKHDEWKKGQKIRQEDWSRGEQVDWHAHHFRRPPSGYEWRQVDGNYILARPSDGAIFSVTVGR